jgi:hypothetical protein
MMKTRIESPQRDRWALLRFAIIGPLLAAPPAPGELATALAALAARSWRHPLTGEPVQFGFSTLERWYYRVRAAENPVLPLRNRLRSNVGQFPSLTPLLIETLTTQYREHPGWTAQLHYDNLQAALQGQDGGCRPTRRSVAISRRGACSGRRDPNAPRPVRSPPGTAWNAWKCAAMR